MTDRFAAAWRLLARNWRLQWGGRRWLRLLGWPGVLGLSLLAACAAFYSSAIRPAQVQLQAVHQNAVSMQEQVKHAAHTLSGSQLAPTAQLAEFYRIFPGDKNLVPWLEKIFAIAQNEGLTLDRGEYKVSTDRFGKLTRFQMTLPVKSEYPRIRKFLNTVRAEIPIVSLEHLQFERQRIDDPMVDAKIVLALYLGHES